MGIEKRTFKVSVHMVGLLLNVSIGKGSVIFGVVLETGADGGNDSLGNKKTMDDSRICDHKI
uniref:Ethylene receptor homolog n=1 Tax=Solanum tuberosum TaxID=4113 RepID=M1CSS7_SOLTU